jgi:hypothetical protein
MRRRELRTMSGNDRTRNRNRSCVRVAGRCVYLWTIGVEIVGLRETHRCGTDHAVAASVGYRVALFLLLVSGYALLVVLAVITARGGAA